MGRVQPFFSGETFRGLLQPVPGPPETIQRGVVRGNPFRPLVQRRQAFPSMDPSRVPPGTPSSYEAPEAIGGDDAMTYGVRPYFDPFADRWDRGKGKSLNYKIGQLTGVPATNPGARDIDAPPLQMSSRVRAVPGGDVSYTPDFVNPGRMSVNFPDVDVPVVDPRGIAPRIPAGLGYAQPRRLPEGSRMELSPLRGSGVPSGAVDSMVPPVAEMSGVSPAPVPEVQKLAERVADEKLRRVTGGGGGSLSGSPLVMAPGEYRALAQQRRAMREGSPLRAGLAGVGPDAENWAIVDGMRRDVDAMEAASSRLSTTQGDSPDAAGLNQDAIARQRGMSQFGYNPHRGLGINGVMRRGVFTPGPGLPEIDGPMALPERRSVVGATPMSDMTTDERTQRLSAMGTRYGFNPTDPVSESGINVGASTSRGPLGREANIAARVASGDLSAERAAEIGANRQAFLGQESERRQRVRDRGIARGQLRSGVVLDESGRLDPTASMMVRGGMLQNPLQAAALGVQREVAAAEGRRQQTMADAQMARFAPEGMFGDMATPEQRRDQQIALGIEMDDLSDSEFTTRVGGMLMDAVNMPPDQALQVLQRNGVRPDHLQRIIGMRDPNIWNLWGAGSAISDLFSKSSDLDIEQQVRSRAEELLKQMGVSSPGGRKPAAPAAAPAATGTPLRPGAAVDPYAMRLDLPY